MKILLDCRFQEGAGPNVTTTYLVENLLRLDRTNQYIILQHRQQQFPELPNVQKIYVPTQKRWAEFLWTQLVLPWILKYKHVDIYHSLKHFGPIFTPTPTIIPIRAVSQFLKGMQKLSLVDWFYWNIIGRIAWQRATHILAVSGICRQVLMDRVSVSGGKVQVIHHGVHDKFRPIHSNEIPDELLSRLGLKGKYILCVGNPYPHKNYETAIRTLHTLYQKAQSEMNLKIAIVGDLSFADSKLYKLTEDLNLKDDIIFTGFVNHDELVYLYNGAELLLFCSIYEAFPNPTLEAMACGLPVVAAKRGAVEEITGNAAVLIDDPMDYEAFAIAIETILLNPLKRQQMVEESLKQASKFRWDTTAKTVLEVYSQLCSD